MLKRPQAASSRVNSISAVCTNVDITSSKSPERVHSNNFVTSIQFEGVFHYFDDGTWLATKSSHAVPLTLTSMGNGSSSVKCLISLSSNNSLCVRSQRNTFEELIVIDTHRLEVKAVYEPGQVDKQTLLCKSVACRCQHNAIASY